MMIIMMMKTKIITTKMKYVITENQLDKFISKYIGKYFGGLKEIDEPRLYLKHFVNENNDVIFYYATDSGNVYIETPGLKEHLVNHLENVLDLGWIRTKKILEDWFLDNYGIEVHKIYGR
jgi:hypothetical protein